MVKKRVDVGDGLDRIRNRGRAKNRPSIMPMIRLSLSINYKKRGICFSLFDLIRDVITPLILQPVLVPDEVIFYAHGLEFVLQFSPDPDAVQDPLAPLKGFV